MIVVLNRIALFSIVFNVYRVYVYYAILNMYIVHFIFQNCFSNTKNTVIKISIILDHKYSELYCSQI